MAGMNLVVMILAIYSNAESGMITLFFFLAVVFAMLGILFYSKADKQEQKEKDKQKWKDGE